MNNCDVCTGPKNTHMARLEAKSNTDENSIDMSPKRQVTEQGEAHRKRPVHAGDPRQCRSAWSESSDEEYFYPPTETFAKKRKQYVRKEREDETNSFGRQAGDSKRSDAPDDKRLYQKANDTCRKLPPMVQYKGGIRLTRDHLDENGDLKKEHLDELRALMAELSTTSYRNH